MYVGWANVLICTFSANIADIGAHSLYSIVYKNLTNLILKLTNILLCNTIKAVHFSKQFTFTAGGGLRAVNE